MAVFDLIKDLESAEGPSRELDAALAILLGYKRKVEQVMDPESGEQTRRSFYIHPGGQDPSRVPQFTASLEDAHLLARTVAPGVAGGVSWDESGGHAKVGDGPVCAAATPAIALCIATLKMRFSE
ncbi:hypothetical protein CN059_27225 [Sinorhizobium medicae]|uniref:Uncharacterized protein n=1 Tax=Sinorhizobium medicae TaxID=110321 RepID=A0ABX4TCL5_9HYPH|nr:MULTISPECIES: hypothetical protein [Sinorhizobium]MDW9371004.1 hypothetical protein [Sinorhizobium meliloti]MDW9546379.1 hypothetical protein [Sinorhizobium meliloti]MDX0716620.1 hypothetical protein [Sinorhizobium medicae]MDX0845079.1 hypothetical protein [Sinorhizobium medicae]MDX1059640.1 hypothetical protein [Sinorhizobium medicae]